MSSSADHSGLLALPRVAGGWVLAVAGPVALTGLLTVLPRGSTLSFEAMLFLALAVAAALVGGRWPAVVASVLGSLAIDYVFTPPLHTLDVGSSRDLCTLLVFLVVSLAVAAVVDSAARRRERAVRAEDEAAMLTMLNRTVLGGEYDVPRLLALLGETLGADTVELVDGPPTTEPGDTVVAAGDRAWVVLRGRVLDGPQLRVLSAFARHLGVLGEREELARQTAAAHELEAGNRTRTALLAAVSHDLRTPLAGIRSAAETLRRHDDRLPPQDRAALLVAIEDSTARLTTMVSDLLDMSRLQTGAVRPALVATSLEEVVLASLHGVAGAERVDVGRLPDALVDPGLLQRVVVNVVANALRHSDRVEVEGEQGRRRVRLRVVDHGPGVAVQDRSRVFEPFQRLGDTDPESGVGLGLAVARGLTEALGGSIALGETTGGGLTVTIELSAVGEP